MGLMERIEKQKTGGGPENKAQENGSSFTQESTVQGPVVDEYASLKDSLHQDVIDFVNKNLGDSKIQEEGKEAFFKNSIESIMNVKGVNISRSERTRVINEVYNDIAGLGPLQPLLEDPDVTEIMVNGPYNIYVEIRGRLELTNVKFKDNAHVMNIINRIVTSVGRRIDESSPMVDARLEDGSRVNAIIPPIALSGPSITIRKFSKNPLTVADLIRFSSVSPKMMSFLEACVKGRLNIVVSGGTGSGKTTLLSVLSGYIPNNERIVTIEDAAELQLRQNHVVTLESRPPNMEGFGQITIRDLVRNALRMRPDRIVVGEVRSGETLDMLQAMNTGHDGSLTTAHANSSRDLLSRLETMVLMSGMEIPVRAIREQISSAVDLIVHQARMRDGSRKIVNISEIVGMEGDTITMQDIFVYKSNGVDNNGFIKGGFMSTGVRPTFLEKLSGSGVLVMDDWFKN